MATKEAETQALTERLDPDHEIATLPKEIWQDDDPAARVAKGYEKAIRSINRAMEPLPWVNRIAGYIAGAIVGMIPGAITYALTKDKPGIITHEVHEMATHIVTTAGVITGMHAADKLMEEPHVVRQTAETAEFLKMARKQARESYKESKANNIVAIARKKDPAASHEEALLAERELTSVAAYRMH
jgi:hypothetical protein